MRYLLAGAVFSVFLVCGIWIANPSYLPLAACVVGIINILLLTLVYRRVIRALQASNAEASNNADDAIAQAQSLAWIEKQIDFRAPPTALTGWAAAPDFAALLVSTILRHQPRLIVEAGSGASTVLVAYCMERSAKMEYRLARTRQVFRRRDQSSPCGSQTRVHRARCSRATSRSFD